MRAVRSDEGTDSGSARHESVPRIEAVLSLHEKTERSIDDHQRFVERVVARIGRPRTIYTLLVAVVVSGLGNEAMPLLFGRRPLDEPPFFWLQGILALYAALVTTMVLTTQNRSQKAAQQRAYLELQVNLMAEEKTTKLISLLEELRRDLPNVRDRVDREAEFMSHTVDPHAVLSALEASIRSTIPPPVSVAEEGPSSTSEALSSTTP